MNLIMTIYDRNLYETTHDFRPTSPWQLLDPIKFSYIVQRAYNMGVTLSQKVRIVTSIALAIFASIVLINVSPQTLLFATGVRQAVSAFVVDCSLENLAVVVESSRAFFCACSLTFMSWQICRRGYFVLSSLIRPPSPGDMKSKLESLSAEIEKCKQAWMPISTISPNDLKLLSLDALKSMSLETLREMSPDVLKQKLLVALETSSADVLKEVPVDVLRAMSSDDVKGISLNALAFEAYKKQASEICAKLCAQFTNHQKVMGTYGDVMDSQLNKMRESVTEILENIAAMEDVDHKESLEHTPFFVLCTLGMTLSGFTKLMKDQRWNELLYTSSPLSKAAVEPVVGWLDLKFAERGVFSRKQLKYLLIHDPKIGPDGTEKLALNLDATVNHIRGILAPEGQKFPPVIIKIDRVASMLFAKAFKVLSLLSEMVIANPGDLLVGLWMGICGHKITRETRHFVNGSLLYRLLWLGTASPMLCLGNVVGLTLRDRQWKAFPRNLYNSYAL